MEIEIRPAVTADAAGVAHVYNDGIEERKATFETRPREEGEIAAEIEGRGEAPFLVAVRDGEIAGWARLTAYSDRQCYSGVGEASLYVARTARGRGVGRRLFEALAAEAAEAGYWKVIGLLFPENEASVALVRACGCRVVGTHLRHGRLDGEWRDVVIVERLLD